MHGVSVSHISRNLRENISVSLEIYDVRMFLRATSAMMDVPTDEQELPEPVKLRVLCEVSDEWEKLGRIRHQRTT